MKPRCPTGKIRYRDQTAARVALVDTKIRAALRDHEDRREANHYQCRACKGWHLTSEPPRGVSLTDREGAEDGS